MTAPFERLRTMMMADARNTSLLATARRMWASGGFLGMWRGNMCSVAKVVPPERHPVRGEGLLMLQTMRSCMHAGSPCYLQLMTACCTCWARAERPTE